MNIDDIFDCMGVPCDYCKRFDECGCFCFTYCGFMYLKAYEMILDGQY